MKQRILEDVLKNVWRCGKRGHFGKTENRTIKEDIAKAKTEILDYFVGLVGDETVLFLSKSDEFRYPRNYAYSKGFNNSRTEILARVEEER